MADERLRTIDPIVPEAIAHNTKVLSQIRSLTSSLFGVVAGILGLESLAGFLFYFIGTGIISFLIAVQLCGGISKVPLYFDDGRATGAQAKGKKPKTVEREAPGSWEGGWGFGIWTRDVTGGLMSFVLTWTLFFGLVRS